VLFIVLGCIPGGIATAFMVVTCTLTIRYVHKAYSPENARRMCSELIWYPVVMVFVMMFLFICELVQNLTSCSGFVLTVVGITCRTSQGLLDALVYGMNSRVRKEVKEYWERRREKKVISKEQLMESIQREN